MNIIVARIIFQIFVVYYKFKPSFCVYAHIIIGAERGSRPGEEPQPGLRPARRGAPGRGNTEIHARPRLVRAHSGRLYDIYDMRYTIYDIRLMV